MRGAATSATAARPAWRSTAAGRQAYGVTRAVLDPQELEFGEQRRRPAAVRSAATRRRTCQRHSGAGHHVGHQHGRDTGSAGHRSGGTGRIRVLRVPLTVAAPVIAGAGRGSRHGVHVHARGHRHRTVVTVGTHGLRDRSETVHTEQAQQQSTHEQPAGPQHRLRSSELYWALHSVTVGTGHRSSASRAARGRTRRHDTSPGYQASRGETHRSGRCEHPPPPGGPEGPSLYYGLAYSMVKGSQNHATAGGS